MARKTTSVLPGFKLTLGYTVLYLGLIVLIPLACTFWKASALTWDQFWHIVTAPRVMASYRLSFGASFLAAFINLFFGLLVAWVLVRYQFFGKRFVDALVDLPFALPTAVAGIALTAVYAPHGWIGQWFEVWNNLDIRGGLVNGYHHIIQTLSMVSFLKPVLSFLTSILQPVWHYLTTLIPSSAFIIKVAYTRLGILIALTFIGLPFIVRTVQPVLEDLDPGIEEAAASLGANRWQTFWRVTLPMLRPALLTGFTLAFARALGEYGSVIFIAGNYPMRTEITPLLIVTKLEEFDYPGATAIAVMMLIASFVLLLTINFLQWWSHRHHRPV
jgi:sulfate transport system permease protein